MEDSGYDNLRRLRCIETRDTNFCTYYILISEPYRNTEYLYLRKWTVGHAIISFGKEMLISWSIYNFICCHATPKYLKYNIRLIMSLIGVVGVVQGGVY